VNGKGGVGAGAGGAVLATTGFGLRLQLIVLCGVLLLFGGLVLLRVASVHRRRRS
jgi:hypothetical protein